MLLFKAICRILILSADNFYNVGFCVLDICATSKVLASPFFIQFFFSDDLIGYTESNRPLGFAYSVVGKK